MQSKASIKIHIIKDGSVYSVCISGCMWSYISDSNEFVRIGFFKKYVSSYNDIAILKHKLCAAKRCKY